MADISKIVLGGTTYNIKDTVARAAIAGGMHFLGVSLSPIADGTTNEAIIKTGTKTANKYYTGTPSTITTYTDSDTTYTLTNVKLNAGDVVIHRSLEFVFSDSDSKWHELGSTGTLGKLAYKDGVSVTYKKATGASFTGTKATITHKVNQGTISASGSTSGVAVSSHSYTPSGTVSNGTPTTKKISSGVTTSQLKTISLRGVAGTTTAVNASYANETLTLSAVTAATANAAATTVATGAVDSKGTGATVATGSSGEIYAITELGTPSFSGNEVTLGHTVTQGDVSVTGTTSGITVDDHTYTPAGSVTITNTDTTVTGS